MVVVAACCIVDRYLLSRADVLDQATLINIRPVVPEARSKVCPGHTHQQQPRRSRTTAVIAASHA